MYVSRALRNTNVSYNEDDTIELCQRLDELGLRTQYQSKVENVVAESVYDEAAKFACLNFDRFVCTDIDRRTIYVYRKNMWRVDHGLKFLTEALVKFCPRAGSSHRYRNELVKDVCHHAYNEAFSRNLAEYRALDVCGTSFDCATGEHRPGVPSDYTSVSTGYPANDDYRAEVEAMIRDIFPDDSIYRYFMRFCGSLLVPGNRDKLFMVWSGTGDNGKSVLARLIELALGEYAVKLPTSLVTGKRASSSAATPEMAIIEKRLVAFLQEPGHKETLNIGVVKELTGNDSMYVRGLYEHGRNISIKAKIVYVVNSTDNLAVIEKAVWNRIVVLPFLTHFTSNPQRSHERQKDLHLNDKLRKYAGSFMGLMIEQAREYIRSGLLPCEAVTETTKQVMTDNDPVGVFLASDMDKSYGSFASYMRQFAPDEPVPSHKAYERRKAAAVPQR